MPTEIIKGNLMSEQPEEQEKTPSKQPISLRDKFRFALIAIVLLYVIVSAFGQKIQASLSGKTKDKTAEKIEEKIIEKPAENHPAQLAEKQPENSIDKKNDPQIEKVVEENVVPSPTSPVVIAETPPQSDERIHVLEEKIASLETAHANALSEMKKNFEAQSSDAQNKSNILLSSLVVFGQLKDAVNNGEPYSAILNQLKTLTTTNQQAKEIITTIEKHSESGIKTTAQLKTLFAPLIKQALTNKNESAFMKILHRFVTVRKVGEQAGDNDEAILARAENKLSKNDLPATLKELEKLSQPVQEIFAVWVVDVQTLLDTNMNLDKLQLTLTQTKPVPQP